MFDNLMPFVLAATTLPKLASWKALFSSSVIWALKGAIIGGCSKFFEHLVDSYCVCHGKEKKYDICKKHIDMSDKILNPMDWQSLKNPYGPPFSLNLRGTNVTDQDLIDHLVGQKLLRKLDVCYCEDITYRGVRKFRKLRRDCKVKHNTLRFWNYLILGFLSLWTLIALIIEIL